MYSNHQPFASLRVHLSGRGGAAHREPAQRRSGVPASLRRHQGLQLRTQGTGSRGHGILQRLQDHLPQILTMHLGQIKPDATVIAAVFEGGLARPIPGHTMLDLIRRAEWHGEPLSRLAATLASRHPEPHPPVLPIHPPEVWACGCTYEMSAAFRDAEHGTREGMYAYVYREARPEIFMKGTARVCVPTGQAIGLRRDAKFTAPEPELAVVLGQHGKIEGDRKS